MASDVRFDLQSEIPIDISHTLDQLTAKFQSSKDGIPELIKNAKDHYSRLNVREGSERQIVVVADSKRHRLAVLDFAGARSEDFEGWTTWSSRTASRSEQSDEIEGGHGNGGKAFMVRGSHTYSYMDSCAKNRRTRMGFQNDDRNGRYKPGYGMDDDSPLNNVVEKNPKEILVSELKRLGFSFKRLPPEAQDAFEKRNAFTIVVIDGVRDWEAKRESTIRRLALDLPGLISEHGQTAMSVESCSVWVAVDGELVTEEPVRPTTLTPYPGFEDLKAVPVPDQLPDPDTGEDVDTGPGGAKKKFLQLATSDKNLKLSEDLKTRNVIRIWNERNNVATWSVPSLGVPTASVAFIYGRLRVPALIGDHLADAHRSSLADTPLTRALEKWTSDQVAALAEKIARAEMQKTKPQDRERASKALQGLRELMRKYLRPDDFAGPDAAGNPGGGTGQDGRKKKRTGTVYGERVDEIVLEPMRRSIALAVGTRIPLLYSCYELIEGEGRRPVRDIELELFCDGLDGLEFDSDGMLYSSEPGEGKIWLETQDGKVKSNSIKIEALNSTDVDMAVPEEVLLQGQRLRVPTVFRTTNGSRDDLLLDASVDELAMAKIGRGGHMTTGLHEGTATVRVRFGAARSQQKAFVFRIGSERAPIKAQGGGGNIPEILLCGDDAPGMESYTKEQRTHMGGEHFPTIIEEPQFANVVWINPTSKEASRVRASRGGPSGSAGIGTKTFVQFVALKCFDILKRLKVRQDIGDQVINETQFTQMIAQAEMDCATFIDAAYEVSEELLAGEGG